MKGFFQRLSGGQPGRPDPPRLGAFLGVFTPTILTILGVIMYLRFGWVLSQMGLARTLLIVVIANSITLVTSLCLAAVATNRRVGVGGAYYMISRSLGLDIGGAIGLPLFLSQALSVTLYAFGLAESLRFVWPEVPVPAAAFVITLAVGALAFRGAGFALRTQLPVMILIGLSLLALSAGSLNSGSWQHFAMDGPAADAGFWQVFAVFFPAVTGIMAGLSLSGDLADPRRAIPRGTLYATLTGFAIYLLIPVILAFGAEPAALREDPLVWTRIALFGPWLILPGLWGAIFSSAVGSMLGAPRTLQALAGDGLAPKVLGRLSGRHREPVNGLLVTLGLALFAVSLGDLNTVATVATMFFLTVYGTVNLVAALEELSGNPSWRPRVRVHWGVSLAAAGACLVVMLLINVTACLIAVTVELLIWVVLNRRERREGWGDVWRDLYESLIRWCLLRLARHPMTARNWRPHVLVFCGQVEKRLDLVRFGAWFSEERGVVTVCELVQGDVLTLDVDTRARQREIENLLREKGIPAFGEVNVVHNLERGILTVAQANGLAGLESNLVLLGLPDELERLTLFLKLIRRLRRLDISLVLGRVAPQQPLIEGRRPLIHIWWGGLQRNGDLMLLLAYLVSHNPEWRNARIRVLSIASNDLMRRRTEDFLQRLIPEIRIQAEVDVMVRSGEQSVVDMIHRESGKADMVFLGLAAPDEGAEEDYARRLFDLAEGLQNCFFVHNGSLFIGELVTAEETGANSRFPGMERPKAGGLKGGDNCRKG